MGKEGHETWPRKSGMKGKAKGRGSICTLTNVRHHKTKVLQKDITLAPFLNPQSTLPETVQRIYNVVKTKKGESPQVLERNKGKKTKEWGYIAKHSLIKLLRKYVRGNDPFLLREPAPSRKAPDGFFKPTESKIRQKPPTPQQNLGRIRRGGFGHFWPVDY